MSTLTTKELKYFDKLQRIRKQIYNVYRHPSQRGVNKLTSDIYPDPAHFVYELLQNADDAKATEATFYLYENALVFKHNGEGFTISDEPELGEDFIPSPYGDINAITAFNSTKDDVTQNKIGKFGLGFKSVYEYTKRPEIYDDKFHFAIEGRMVPRMLQKDHPLRKQGETLFYLPFDKPKSAYNVISNRLDTLEAPTLFLYHLKNVNYINKYEHTENKYSKTIKQTQSTKNLRYETVSINDLGKTETIVLFHRKIKIPDQSIKAFIAVGYYLTENEEINTETKRGIHCFFPTKETFDLCFVSHAPFLLSNNRQNIVEHNSINRYLITEICKLAADALIVLRDYKVGDKTLLEDNLYSILPYHYYVTQSNWYNWESEKQKLTSKYTFLKAVKDIINEEPLLYTLSKKYVIADNACVLTTSSLRPLLNTQLIRRLINKNDLEILKVENNTDLREFLKDFFDVTLFSPNDFAWKISSEFMQEHGLEWAIRLYKYLKEDARSLWGQNNFKASPFRIAPIFLSHQNEWIAPYQWDGNEFLPNIYFPINNAKGDYNFIHQSLMERADDGLISFFKDLGIGKPDIIDYIKKYVFPKYRNNEFDNKSLKNDFYTLLAILEDPENRQRKNEIFDVIKENLILMGSDGNLHSAKDIYEKSPDLSRYFSNNHQVIFFNEDFYYDENSYIEKEDINKFAISLGVKSYPIFLKNISSNEYSFNRLRKTPVIFKRTTTHYSIKDYSLDGLSIFIEHNLDNDTSIYLWRLLSIIEIEDYLYGKYDYYYRTSKSEEFDSNWLDILKHEKWIVDKNGHLYTVDEVKQEDLQEFGYPENEELYEIFNIKARGKTIRELGATEEQQRQQELGATAEKLGLSEDDLHEMAEIKRQREIEMSREQTSSRHNQSLTDNTNSRDDISTHTYGSLPTFEGTTNTDELFESTSNISIKLPRINNDTSRKITKDIDELKRKIEEDGKSKIERELLKQDVESLEKYSKEWFKAKLELEYKDSITSERANSEIKRSILITFSRLIHSDDNIRIYELRNPSRDIPLWIEDVENINIDFLFNNRDEFTCGFEVANVRDYSLRLKAKPKDSEKLNTLDWSKFTKATLDINTPTNLLNNFRQAFNRLLLPDGFNLKQNLHSNISFVFGPPGTGKTTHLAKYIVEEMNNSRRSVYRILVLAPTNKACDVLVKKIMELDESYTWLGRFVTTGDSEIEEMGVVCDRDSNLYAENKCCIVTTMARLPYDGFKDEIGEHNLREIDWNLVICDEASMLPIAQIIYAIYNFKNTRFLIAGDPMQISPIDVTNNWNSENIYDMINLKSFESPRTEPISFDVHNLKTQFRSIPVIGGLFSDYAYNGSLNHHWKQSDQRCLNIRELPLKSINFIPFRVESYDSMFGIKKLAGSPIHIYSALLCSQLSKFIANKYVENNPDEENISIGVICPYASQAQLIQKMLEQETNIAQGADISVGTIHSFQGDQCDIILAMLNPPTGLKREAIALKTHINNKNIINVAISRAKDYLCLLIPDKENFEGFDNLIEIKRLGTLTNNNYRSETALFTASQIENIIFGQSHFLEANTFVTTHQLANVYTNADYLYEVRVDENSIDIQINMEKYIKR